MRTTASSSQRIVSNTVDASERDRFSLFPGVSATSDPLDRERGPVPLPRRPEWSYAFRVSSALERSIRRLRSCDPRGPGPPEKDRPRARTLRLRHLGPLPREPSPRAKRLFDRRSRGVPPWREPRSSGDRNQTRARTDRRRGVRSRRSRLDAGAPARGLASRGTRARLRLESASGEGRSRKRQARDHPSLLSASRLPLAPEETTRGFRPGVRSEPRRSSVFLGHAPSRRTRSPREARSLARRRRARLGPSRGNATDRGAPGMAALERP